LPAFAVCAIEDGHFSQGSWLKKETILGSLNGKGIYHRLFGSFRTVEKDGKTKLRARTIYRQFSFSNLQS
jgi:hypothetical protein